MTNKNYTFAEYSAYFVDWIPVSTLPIIRPPRASKIFEVHNNNFDNFFPFHTDAYKEYVKPFVESFQYCWRADGILLFRFVSKQNLRDGINNFLKELNDHDTSSPPRTIHDIRKDNHNRSLEPILEIIEAQFQNSNVNSIEFFIFGIIAEQISNAIKRKCGHIDAFHDSTSIRDRKRVFSIRPVRIIDPLGKSFRKKFNEAFDASPDMNDISKWLENETLLAQFSAWNIPERSSKFPALVKIRQNAANIREKVLSVVSITKKKRFLYSEFNLIILSIILIGILIGVATLFWENVQNHMFLRVFLYSSVPFIILVAIYGIYWIYHWGKNYRVRDLPETILRSFISKKFQINFLIIILLSFLISIIYVVIFDKSVNNFFPNIGQNEIFARIIPITSAILIFYAIVEIGIRRRKVLNLLRDARGFLTYFHVYSLVIEDLYNRIHGTSQKDLFNTDGFNFCIKSLEIKYDGELEKLNRSKDRIIIIAGILSAYAALHLILGSQ